MVYVQRDTQGRLLRAESSPFAGYSQVMAVEDPELHNWLDAREEMRLRLDNLGRSDIEMVRVLEDLVTVLVDRSVIRYTDLPEAARQKLDQRAIARAEIEGLSSLLDEGELALP